MESLLVLAAGLVVLTLGAEALVRGASRLAVAAGVSSLVVGLTVVAFGTSAPELAVSMIAGVRGQADISVGNVVGSNIFNVLFILGASALVAPLTVSLQLIRLDVPIMIGVSILVVLTGWDGRISRVEGVALFLLLVAYTTFLIRKGRNEQSAEFESELGRSERSPVIFDICLVAVGLAMLVLGSSWFVKGAVTLAVRFGVSELVIGLTIVAAGTSLPELATSVVASLRGERDIAVGNVVGSNIFNILCVLGLSGVVSPAGLTVSRAAMSFDIPVMIAVAAACLPIFFTGYVIERWEGALFLAYYIAYSTYLVLVATQSPSRAVVQFALGAIVIPLTVVTLAVITYRSWREPSRQA